MRGASTSDQPPGRRHQPLPAAKLENPVDWWEWGPEAFEEARRRDVPVLSECGIRGLPLVPCVRQVGVTSDDSACERVIAGQACCAGLRGAARTTSCRPFRLPRSPSNAGPNAEGPSDQGQGDVPQSLGGGGVQGIHHRQPLVEQVRLRRRALGHSGRPARHRSWRSVRRSAALSPGRARRRSRPAPRTEPGMRRRRRAGWPGSIDSHPGPYGR